jgi:hypothetical protein
VLSTGRDGARALVRRHVRCGRGRRKAGGGREPPPADGAGRGPVGPRWMTGVLYWVNDDLTSTEEAD